MKECSNVQIEHSFLHADQPVGDYNALAAFIQSLITVRSMVQHTPTILIVEQDDATRELYQRELGRRFRVVTSSNAEQTLALLRNDQFDALVLEPSVSNGAGWTLLEALQASPPLAPPHIVLCSALDERRRGMSLGADAYLVKPVLPSALLSTLDQIL